MINLQLIKIQYIKDFSPLMNDVENQFIEIHLSEAQDIDLRYSLGNELYEDLMNQYYDFTQHPGSNIDTYVSPEYQYIKKEYIERILLYYTLYRSRFSIESKLTNKGVEQQHSNYSTNAYSKRVDEMVKNWKNMGETYVARLLEYMVKNINLYPKYSEYLNNCDNVNKSGFDSGIYLGKEL